MGKKRSYREPEVTVKAVWNDTGTVMLFGTSYRTWWDQLAEYCGLNKVDPPTITVAQEPWISYGGLKWCSPNYFQDLLNDEANGLKDKPGFVPRKVSDFVFRPPTPIELNCLHRIQDRTPAITPPSAVILAYECLVSCLSQSEADGHQQASHELWPDKLTDHAYDESNHTLRLCFGNKWVQVSLKPLPAHAAKSSQ